MRVSAARVLFCAIMTLSGPAFADCLCPVLPFGFRTCECDANPGDEAIVNPLVTTGARETNPGFDEYSHLHFRGHPPPPYSETEAERQQRSQRIFEAHQEDRLNQMERRQGERARLLEEQKISRQREEFERQKAAQEKAQRDAYYARLKREAESERHNRQRARAARERQREARAGPQREPVERTKREPVERPKPEPVERPHREFRETRQN